MMPLLVELLVFSMALVLAYLGAHGAVDGALAGAALRGGE